MAQMPAAVQLASPDGWRLGGIAAGMRLRPADRGDLVYAPTPGSNHTRIRFGVMGFTMGSDNFGVIGAIVAGAIIIVGLMVLAFLLSAAKQAHDDVVEDEGDRPDLIG